MTYQKRLKDLREDHDLTQQQIANILKINQRAYSRYEIGTYELPIKHLITLCEFYNVSPEYILGFINENKPLK